MKKVIILMGLGLLCITYFFIMKSKVGELNTSNEKSLAMLFDEEKKILLESYPKDVKQVMDAHNKIMGYLYSEKMEESLAGDAALLLRCFYSKDLLSLNPEEQHKTILEAEIAEHKERKIYLINSKIEQIEYMDNNTKAKVLVTHYTTQGDQIRDYELIVENSKWKIERWENKMQELNKNTEEIK